MKKIGKPRIAIVGAGNLASALAASLHQAGYAIDQIVSRGKAESLRRARRLAAEVGSSVVVGPRMHIVADVVWFCVPDAAIKPAAESLKNRADWKGKVAIHSSGALAGNELAELRRRGAAVASVHPLMTFVRRARPSLRGVPFAMEGDRRALTLARSIVRNLQGEAFVISKRHKSVYHAWGMFASPLLTALLSSAEQVAVAAGMPPGAARRRMLPILRQTFRNYERLGGADAFSGPIARGDVETVRKHLEDLRTIPGARDLYVALGRAALARLPARNRIALRKILKK